MKQLQAPRGHSPQPHQKIIAHVGPDVAQIWPTVDTPHGEKSLSNRENLPGQPSTDGLFFENVSPCIKTAADRSVGADGPVPSEERQGWSWSLVPFHTLPEHKEVGWIPAVSLPDPTNLTPAAPKGPDTSTRNSYFSPRKEKKGAEKCVFEIPRGEVDNFVFSERGDQRDLGRECDGLV